MKKEVLFIGGPWDGKKKEVELSPPFVRAHKLPMAATTDAFLTEGYPQTVPLVYVDYTLRCLYLGNGDRLQYYAPRDWSDFRALHHVFHYYTGKSNARESESI